MIKKVKLTTQERTRDQVKAGELKCKGYKVTRIINTEGEVIAFGYNPPNSEKEFREEVSNYSCNQRSFEFIYYN